MTTNPYEVCPPDDFYCPYCGAKLIDQEVQDMTSNMRPGTKHPEWKVSGQKLSCSSCGAVTAIQSRAPLSAEEGMRLWKLRNPQVQQTDDPGPDDFDKPEKGRGMPWQ